MRDLDLWWIGGSFDETPSSDDVGAPLAHVHLFGRGLGPLNFRSDRVACGDFLSALLGRLLCKGCLRFFPLNTAPVVRRVVSPATTALTLFPRGSATAGEVGAPTGDAPGSVSAVTLRVSEALAALALQWVFRGHVRLHRHSQAADFGKCSHF